ncbi:peptidoglycan DD-metalloendopeptidase family protein [Saccharospirillum sp. MSK14-1]|uniref:peptidoglycan DD-metalloendopeptidase family protein n=1 Tax=Saccharospirillum sp. MSK14-1 TaxID=1897632 RepID=UPI000D3BF715|nr:peptidoglycan DD-metalloendopeptidase family protein [Saccharospirillum sp. MSK14-1]
MARLLSCVMIWGCSLVVSAAQWPSGYGQWVSGGYFIGHTEPFSRVVFNGVEIDVDGDGYYLLPFERDSEGPQQLSITLASGDIQHFEPEIDRRDFNVQRIDGLDPNRVEPPPEVIDRILADAERAALARQQYIDSNAWRQPFIWPVRGRISGVYGSQRILNGEPRQPHWGVDLARPTGTPVRAPADGVITLAEPDMYFSGGTIMLNHGAGLSSTFLHLSRLDVSVGTQVVQGDVIGAVGSTGRSTGPHLDWRINAGEARIDAAYWVPPQDELCEPEGEGEEVVLLLHGLGRGEGSMNALAGDLRDAGFATCNQAYPSRQQSLPQLSGYAANALDGLEQAGYQRVHLVTHSMGGILARYLLQYRALPGDGRLVMLSPPNHGSEIVDAFGDQRWFQWLMGPAAGALATDKTALVNRLAPIETRTGIITGTRSSDPWFNFLFDGEHDGKVSVDSARLNEADGFRLVDAGHTFIMRDREVRALVIEFLQQGVFVH